MADDAQVGLGVDAGGDPTANVLALVGAANRRQDDLRYETNRRIDTALACVKEVSDLKAAHVKEMGEVRATHADAMAIAESKRLDAVRAIDVLNGSTAAERSQVAVQVLATKTATDAENSRAALTAAAATIANQSAINFAADRERIAALEKSSYEGAGKSKVADPALEALLAEVRRLSGVQQGGAGRSEGMQYFITMGLAIAGIAVAIAVYLK